mgnify:CR=1 FL=1
MRCGICGKDTMRHPRSGDQIPMHDHDALSRHKILEHPIEYRAAREARQAKADATRRAKVAEAQRVSDVRLAASRPVVMQYAGETELITGPSSQLARYQVNSSGRVRFPDAEAYRQYQRVMATITGLEAEARAYLTEAWEMGTPVTLEHLDELDRAAEVSPQAR